MRFSPLLLLAQAAALSSAFLVPPQVSDNDLKDIVPIDIGAGLALSEMSMSRVVRIPCDGCHYKEEGVATDIILDFNLPEGDHSHMSLNGHQVFPVSFKGDQRLVATQMPHDVSTIVYMVDREKFPQVTLDNSRLVTTDVITESGAREYTFELSIFAVDATPVKLEGLQMIILQSPSGELSFGPIRPIPKNETCGANIKCMISKMMFRLRHMRKPWGRKGGCKGRKGGKHQGGKIDNHPVEGLDAVPPKHHHHHHHPHRPHHGVFHRIAAQVLLPIFVGIAAGMTVSLIGLVLGHGFMMLWYKFRGLKRGPCCKAGRRRGFFCHRRRERQEREALAAAEADGEVEKGLLQEEEHVECPPAYVDAPVSDLEVVEKQ